MANRATTRHRWRAQVERPVVSRLMAPGYMAASGLRGGRAAESRVGSASTRLAAATLHGRGSHADTDRDTHRRAHALPASRSGIAAHRLRALAGGRLALPRAPHGGDADTDREATSPRRHAPSPAASCLQRRSTLRPSPSAVGLRAATRHPRGLKGRAGPRRAQPMARGAERERENAERNELCREAIGAGVRGRARVPYIFRARGAGRGGESHGADRGAERERETAERNEFEPGRLEASQVGLCPTPRPRRREAREEQFSALRLAAARGERTETKKAGWDIECPTPQNRRKNETEKAYGNVY